MTDEQRFKIISARKNGVGYASIAKDIGMTKNAVAAFCRRNGLTGNLSENTSTAEGGLCRECGKPLVQVDGMKTRVFCSHACKTKWWRAHPEKMNRKATYDFVCACCGKPFSAYGNSKRKYCSHECYIADRFKGGDGNECTAAVGG